MPRGVPKAGFRMTRKRMSAGLTAKQILSGKAANPAIVASDYAPDTNETDAQIRAKLDERFEALALMTESAVEGEVRAVVVSGPAGVGKSHDVSAILAKRNPYHTIVRGFVRPTGLYKTLYEYRHPGCVVVFDDADSIFDDMISLNILKAACDTTRKREISWLSEIRMEDEGGDKMPRSFEFEGSIIFITNTDFDAMIERGSKLAPHFQALVSRSMYIDLAMKTKRDYLVRIHQVLEAGMLREHKMSKTDEAEILRFIETNIDRMRELSLRIVVKIASLKRANPIKWQKLAKVVCCKGIA